MLIENVAAIIVAKRAFRTMGTSLMKSMMLMMGLLVTFLMIVMISMMVIFFVWALVSHTNSPDSFREEDIN